VQHAFQARPGEPDPDARATEGAGLPPR
jgi:hypothetical protein